MLRELKTRLLLKNIRNYYKSSDQRPSERDHLKLISLRKLLLLKRLKPRPEMYFIILYPKKSAAKGVVAKKDTKGAPTTAAKTA